MDGPRVKKERVTSASFKWLFRITLPFTFLCVLGTRPFHELQYYLTVRGVTKEGLTTHYEVSGYPQNLKGVMDTKDDILEYPWNRTLNRWEPPSWITNYIEWHREVRSTHPAFNGDNEAPIPPLYVVHCRVDRGSFAAKRISDCGGLHDRLGSLPFDLYIANQTKRLLLYVWETPTSLETFLVPNLLNWTLDSRNRPDLRLLLETAPNLFTISTKAFAKSGGVWTQMPEAISRGMNHSVPMYVSFVIGHHSEYSFENALRKLQETDMIHTMPTFGWIWHALFKPSPGRERYLEASRNAMNLTKGGYTAIHIRLHYPTLMKEAKENGLKLKSLDDPEKFKKYGFDKGDSGIVFKGDGKKFAVDIGLHAVQCARKLTKGSAEPLYLMSDANYLAAYLGKHSGAGSQKRLGSKDPLDKRVNKMLSKITIVTRHDIHKRNYHIDGHMGNATDFFPVFADLYLGMEAQCITFGYGGFGRFARQLTNNTCYSQHQLFLNNSTWYKGHSLHDITHVC